MGIRPVPARRQVIYHLACGGEDLRRQMAQAAVVQPLVALLHGEAGSVPQLAACALGALACGSDALCNNIASAGAFPALVAVLRNNQAVLSKHAAGVPVSETLQRSAARGVEAAALALANLAAAGDALTQRIVAAGALPPALALLRLPEPAAAEAASSLLRSAACCDDAALREKIVLSGALPPLIALLKHYSPTVVADAAAALAALAADSDSIRDRIVEAGAVPPLTALLHGSAPIVVGHATQVRRV